MDLRLPLTSALVATLAALIAGCATAPREPPRASAPAATPAPTPPSVNSSKYYKDDGPGDNPPADLDTRPDAVPRLEPLHRFANRPYTVLGRDYVPATALRAYRERGVASWYGRKFHGQKTSTGETYDMYAMTAAHPTLPLPSYARVTSIESGRTVVVRVNDRGPFLHGRVIDLSYAAAHRIGIAQRGSGEVSVEAVIPPSAVVAAAPLPPVVESPPPVVTAAAAPPVEPAASVERSRGYVVQLGAFANFSNARAFLAHVQNQTAAAQVEASVREAHGLYRVYVGPYADIGQAREAASRISRAFGLAGTVTAH